MIKVGDKVRITSDKEDDREVIPPLTSAQLEDINQIPAAVYMHKTRKPNRCPFGNKTCTNGAKGAYFCNGCRATLLTEAGTAAVDNQKRREPATEARAEKKAKKEKRGFFGSREIKIFGNPDFWNLEIQN